MSTYTGNGDRGLTELVRTKNVSKSDNRVELLGTIEELSCHLGVIRTLPVEIEVRETLKDIQMYLKTVAGGVSDPYSKEGHLGPEATEKLEREISRMEGAFTYQIDESLPGDYASSAQIDLARSVARRAERVLAAVSVKFGADTGAKKFMNRLSDYLYTLARYQEVQKADDPIISETAVSEQTSIRKDHAEPPKQAEAISSEKDLKTAEIVREVLKRMGIQGRISLDAAKRLIEEVEKEAQRQDKKAVIAVCGPDGNPIAVHVMDGAFLVSFDVAVKKAYTAVAVKMSTMELNALAQPGGTFYGLDKMEGGNIIIFGGGIPLKVGDTIVGGLGVSGGTGEEDHALAQYGASLLTKIL